MRKDNIESNTNSRLDWSIERVRVLHRRTNAINFAFFLRILNFQKYNCNTKTNF